MAFKTYFCTTVYDNHLYNSTYPQPHADAGTTEKILFNTMTYTF